MKNSITFRDGLLWLAISIHVSVTVCFCFVVGVHSRSFNKLTEQVSGLKTWQKQEMCEHSFNLIHEVIPIKFYIVDASGDIVCGIDKYYKECVKCNVRYEIYEEEYCKLKKEQLRSEIKSLCPN